MLRLIAPFLAVLVLTTSSVHGQGNPATLARAAIDQLEAAHTALNDAQRVSDRVAALSQTIRGYEDGLNALREGLRRAALREAALRREFDAESEQVSRLLGVLLGMQSSAGPLALLHPAGPIDTARSAMIVAEITPAIQQQAEDLRRRIEEVALLRALQESAADTLQRGLAGVQQARTALSQAISNRTELPQRFLSDPAQLQALINSSETLEGFASGLSDMDIGDTVAGSIRDFRAAKGTIALPVSGTILRWFNEPDAAGVRRPGLLLATRPLSLVTAPWSATLRYRGPLLDYGNVMIIEPEAGILMVLAGLGTVYGEVGQVLVPNTALGLMGGASPDPERFFANAVTGAGSDQTETLYIELRIGGAPVDPAGWFAETKE
ncbi:MAG: murein hydrolase activator EnvC family protein [Paracoccaceae bacterium]